MRQFNAERKTCLEQLELGVVNFPIEVECRLLSNYLYRIRYA